MKLKLEQYFVYENDVEKPCDATIMFFENPDRKEIVFTHNEVVVMFKSRHSKVSLKDESVYLQVLDVDTGECLEFNARKDMHELMIKYMLYPPIILNVLKQ